MKKIPFKKKHLIAFFALCAPIILVSGRDVVLRELSEYFHVTKLAPSMVSKPSCENDICSTSTSFDLNQEIIKKYKNTTVGTYGAEIDSYLNVFGEDIEPIKTKNEIRPTWMKFRTWSIDTKNASSGTVKLICISPMGTKKLGLASNALYIGSKNDLEIIQFVHSLYNIHSYFLLALAILFVGFFIFFSATIVDSISTSELIKKTLVLSFASILFSTILDDLFVGIGIPFPVIPNLPQLLWGPVLLLSVFDPGNKRKFFITLWIIRIICSSASWKYQEFFLYNTYRWAVLTVIVVSAIEVFKNPKKRFVTPYLIFAFWDYLCLINFVAVRSAVYLSPLGFLGLFISEHIGYLSAILDHHIYWYERRVLSKRLQELRDAKSIDKEEWLALQIEVCKSLRNATGASRIGWVYLGFDSPIVLSVEGETVKKYEDGQLPPVFARVIQTKQSLWWVTDKELASFFPGHISRPSTNYKTNRAVVLPILVGADSYGAVALTEFENIQEIMNSDDKRQQLEQIITSFVDLISVQLVKKKESSSSLLQKQANELIRAFSEGVASLGKRNEIIEMFLKLVAKNSPCSAMYFDFEPKTERLHLITAVNMEDEQFKQWSDIPFRARPTNRISPFAITINEKRSVFIDNIQSFFNFLTPQSIEVLSVSGTKGFICSPVIFADQVIGLVCLLDIPGEDPLKSHVISIVELAIKYFAYQLNQLEVAGLVRAQEGVLRKFADPELVKLLMDSAESKEIVVGEVRDCAILVQDLRGSTLAARIEKDPKNLARKWAQVYQVAASLAHDHGASFDKGNGDGMITTLPISEHENGKSLELALSLLFHVEDKAKELLQIHSSIMILYRGKPFRGIMGNTWRIGWDTCGYDISDAYIIEKKAKLVSGIVLAISERIVREESEEIKNILKSFYKEEVLFDGLSEKVYLYDKEGADKLSELILPKRKVA